MQNKPPGMDAPWVPKLIKHMSRINVWVYRRTNGRVGGTWRVGAAFRKPVKLALLTHTGRKSGKEFTAPLLFLRDGENVVFVASQGGLPKNPQWYHNLVATPECTVQVRSDVRRMVARTATLPERAVLWPRLTGLYADFDSYQSWTEREIPVVICEPA
ncbi:deazaflavin-dependent oxidoreductase (nitroreductase family) [Nocardioides daedukensis]|uniref:Deazaflavin-dependent oxidoreductase (Nitroreductase family) n=1 Tax=Nocardioides daedukensis TaxID=634462 RepID=A0A7Y9RYT5_9ACTN|nr:nitroreductase family deazaflavin-dependent oxidoreductase [Nocardioides daedukensis]NYG59136.1 deazaflavin-dependent oxidoreductase (nitroreductase family) [Nocardioides daedukensis]